MSASVLDFPDAPEATEEVAEAKSSIGRRRVLAVLGGGLGLAACSNVPTLPLPGMPPAPPSPGAPPTPGAPPPPTAPAPPPPATGGPVPTVRTSDAIVHLLSRATFGATPELVAQVTELGIEGWIAQQLDPMSIGDGTVDSFLNRYPILNASAQEIQDTDSENMGRESADGILQRATLIRQTFSTRQLYEKVLEFMGDHLNVAVGGDEWGLRTVEDRELYRAVDDNGVPMVLGKFADFLIASAKSPAMLRFLNLASSRGDGDNTPDENYAREIMELHTLGAGRGYTEADVKAAARLLTGFTYDDNRLYEYDPDRHFVGPLTILGVDYPNNDQDGEAAAEQFIASLARLPGTANYLAEKLVQTFVADDVTTTGTLVADLAAVYTANDTAIAPVITALFTSPEFNASVGQKFRRPVDRVAGAIRAAGFGVQADPEEDNRLTGIARYLGHLPHAWATPDGYEKTMDFWMASGGLVASWNFYANLLNGGYDNMLSSADEAVAALAEETAADTAGAYLDALAQRLLFQTVSAEHSAVILEYLGLAAGDAVDDANAFARVAGAALLSSPYFFQQ